MFTLSKNFLENIHFISEKDRRLFESAIQDQQRTSLFEIRETERMMQYLENQSRFFQKVRKGLYEDAFLIYKNDILPAWDRTAKKGDLNLINLYSTQVTMLAGIAVECGVPYNISYMQAYIYLLHLCHTNSEEEALYIAYRSLFDFFDMIHEFQQHGSLSDVVTESLNFIQTHLHQKITINDIALHVNISPRQLTRKFKAEMGMTIIDYVNSQRVAESEYILLHTDATVTDIALSIGFSSESYFIDVFKSINNMTPNAYRKNLSDS